MSLSKLYNDAKMGSESTPKYPSSTAVLTSFMHYTNKKRKHWRTRAQACAYDVMGTQHCSNRVIYVPTALTSLSTPQLTTSN